MAQDRASTLVLASPATPQSLDSEYDVSLGTFETVAACYDSLVEYVKIPDPGVPTGSSRGHPGLSGSPRPREHEGQARRKLGDRPQQPVDSLQAARRRDEQLGATSSRPRTWSGPGTASWGSAPSAASSPTPSASGGRSRSRPRASTSARSTSTIRTPLLLKLQPNLYSPIYDSTKCKEVGGADDPWATEFLKNETAGYGPYRIEQLTRGAQAVFKARDDYYGGKAPMETVIMREVPTSANRAQAAAGRRGGHRAVPAAARAGAARQGAGRDRGDDPRDLHALDRAQRQDSALRQHRTCAAR